MALRGGPVRSSSSAVTVPGWRPEDFLRFETNFLEEGVVSGLAVSQHAAGANMQVDVSAGLALINITTTLLSPNETINTWLSSDAVVEVTVPTADATNPRIDRIVAKFDMSVDPNGAASNIVSITLVEGTPAGSPSAPAEPSNAITLALISVPASDTTISTGQITDSRTYVMLDTAVLTGLCRQGLLNMSVVAGGTGDALTLTYDPPFTAYTAGMVYFFKATAANTTAATANVSGLGAKTFKKWLAGALADLVANDLLNGLEVMALYDGTYLQIISQLPSQVLPAPGTSGNILQSNGSAWVSTAKTFLSKPVAASAADSTTLTNPTSATAYDTHTFSIPANELITGVKYPFEIRGTVTHGAAGTFELGVGLGASQDIFAVFNSTTGTENIHMKGYVMGRAAAGAAAEVDIYIEIKTDGTPVTGVGCAFALVNKATNGILALTFFGKFGTSNGGNDTKLQTSAIEKMAMTAFT